MLTQVFPGSVFLLKFLSRPSRSETQESIADDQRKNSLLIEDHLSLRQATPELRRQGIRPTKMEKLRQNTRHDLVLASPYCLIEASDRSRKKQLFPVHVRRSLLN